MLICDCCCQVVIYILKELTIGRGKLRSLSNMRQDTQFRLCHKAPESKCPSDLNRELGSQDRLEAKSRFTDDTGRPRRVWVSGLNRRTYEKECEQRHRNK